MSITKRHYNNGYYIARTNGNQTPETKAQDKVAHTKTKRNLYPVQSKEEQNSINVYSDQTVIAENNSIASNGVEIHNKGVSRKHTQHAITSLTQKPTITENREQIRKSAFETKKISGDSGEREALSLFWIIILVILVLWAIGFLAGGFGLGGLINILLVIALVLLILWLLRIL